VKREIKIIMSPMPMLNITNWKFCSGYDHSKIEKFSDNTYQRNNKCFGIQIYKLCDSNGYLYNMKVNYDNYKFSSDMTRVVMVFIGYG
jgi:hypothetical protein